MVSNAYSNCSRRDASIDYWLLDFRYSILDSFSCLRISNSWTVVGCVQCVHFLCSWLVCGFSHLALHIHIFFTSRLDDAIDWPGKPSGCGCSFPSGIFDLRLSEIRKPAWLNGKDAMRWYIRPQPEASARTFTWHCTAIAMRLIPLRVLMLITILWQFGGSRWIIITS